MVLLINSLNMTTIIMYLVEQNTVSYLSKIGSDSSYTIDSSWLDRVQEVVDMCINNDLYVIVNMHGDGYRCLLHMQMA